MAGNKRERQLARDRYLRAQARRAVADSRRKRRQQIVASVLAVAVVVAGLAFLAVQLGGDDDDATATIEPAASADPTPAEESPSPSSTATTPTAPPKAGDVRCTYTSTGDATKDVGLPPVDAAKADPFAATVTTNQGTMKFTSVAEAPCTSRSFAYLAGKKYFNGTKCHRLTTEGLFVLQCGDPAGDGSGGPGYGFGVENVPAEGKFPAGTVAMARSDDPGSNGSQFFIVYEDTELPTETGGYTIFGKITEGLDVVKKVAEAGSEPAGDGAPKQAVRLEKVTTDAS